MTSNNSAPLWGREIVAINALVFVAYGAAFMLFPAKLASLCEIELTSPTALADVRAIYGGLSLGAGVLFALGFRRKAWLAPSLFLVASTSAGLALGRIYSMLVSGMPSSLVLTFLATEIGSCVWALLAYRALGPAQPDLASNYELG